MALIRSGQVADFAFQVDGGAADKLRVASFTGAEAMSAPFLFHLELVSTDRAIDFTTVVGKQSALTIAGPAGKRHVHGVVSRFEAKSNGSRFATYEADLVPTVWLLSRRSTCRIYQGMSAPDIVKKVLTDAGIPANQMKFSLRASFPPREYCVQYRETDFAFISRLLEEEGIAYWFEHSASEDVLVMADDKSAALTLPGRAKIAFRAPGGLVEDEEHVYDFRYAQEVRSGKTTLRDYNYEKPSLNLEVNSQADKETELEVYDYPGAYSDAGEGNRLVAARLEELRATRAMGTGTSDVRRLLPGFRFNLADHWRSDLNAEYLLIRVEHSGSQPRVREEEAAGDKAPIYENTFHCIPSSVAFRPERLTTKPAIVGVQPAVVVGPKGEEIYTDSQGRVKVQFPWDREGQSDDKSSCWIRVSQEWAGVGWGAFVLPRIGHEVLVTFLEGDPDRPLVTGRVYNGANTPPYALPGEKTKTTVKSDSSKGGQGANEIRFEDLKGSEQLFVQAEKDFDHRVKHDAKAWIGNESHLIVKKDQIELVEGDKHQSVKGNRNVKIEGGGSLDVKMEWDHKAGMSYAVEAGTDVHLKAGTNVTIEAGASITLKAGGGFIVVGPAGVTVSGTPILLNSGGSAGSGPGCSPTAPKDPLEADKANPGSAPQPPPKAKAYSPAALVLKNAAQNGTPFCEECEKARKAQAAQGQSGGAAT
jgi:type VI secretion system secreted protein VgrG